MLALLFVLADDRMVAEQALAVQRALYEAVPGEKTPFFLAEDLKAAAPTYGVMAGDYLYQGGNFGQVLAREQEGGGWRSGNYSHRQSAPVRYALGPTSQMADFYLSNPTELGSELRRATIAASVPNYKPTLGVEWITQTNVREGVQTVTAWRLREDGLLSDRVVARANASGILNYYQFYSNVDWISQRFKIDLGAKWRGWHQEKGDEVSIMPMYGVENLMLVNSSKVDHINRMRTTRLGHPTFRVTSKLQSDNLIIFVDGRTGESLGMLLMHRHHEDNEPPAEVTFDSESLGVVTLFKADSPPELRFGDQSEGAFRDNPIHFDTTMNWAKLNGETYRIIRMPRVD